MAPLEIVRQAILPPKFKAFDMGISSRSETRSPLLPSNLYFIIVLPMIQQLRN